MLRLRALCFAFLLLVPSAAAFGQAPATPAPAVDAREAFRRGEAAYSAGNYDMAIREWTNAYAADPRPRIQFNLSQAYERIGDLEKAMTALRKFLDSADPDDPMYSDANARLSALQQRVAATGLLVRGGAEGGLITVDQQDWGRTPRPDKITLAPGSHVLVVTWVGQPEFRTNVIVPAGQVIEVALPADAGKGAVATTGGGTTVAAGNGSTRSDSGNGKKIGLIVGGSVAATAGVVMAILGGVHFSDKVDCGGNTYCPDPSQNDAVNRQSLGLLIPGAALALGGAGLIVWGVLSGKNDNQQASTQCGLGLASGSCKFRF